MQYIRRGGEYGWEVMQGLVEKLSQSEGFWEGIRHGIDRECEEDEEEEELL